MNKGTGLVLAIIVVFLVTKSTSFPGEILMSNQKYVIQGKVINFSKFLRCPYFQIVKIRGKDHGFFFERRTLR